MNLESKVLEGYKIFVAEDDHDIQLFMKRTLERCGASVRIASNGSEAVEALLQESFDVALMDIEMPICNGFEAVGTLRAAGYKKPIVAISARYTPTDFKPPYSEFFDEKLPKPVSLPRLIATIKHLHRAGPGNIVLN
jgi:CheY-like chemotaxis protein